MHPPSPRRTPLTARTAVALAVTAMAGLLLAAGCGNDTNDTGGGDSDSDTDGTSQTAGTDDATASPSLPPTPAGKLVNRNGYYSFYLPPAWSDITDQSVVHDRTEGDAFISLDQTGHPHYGSSVIVNMVSDWKLPPGEWEATARDYTRDSQRFINPRIRRTPNTRWNGHRAAHWIGPGRSTNSRFQEFMFNDGTRNYSLRIETQGGRAYNTKIVHKVRTTWEWDQ